MYCVCCVRSSPAGTVTHDDILDITEAIAEDGRYKALDRMDADRKLLLFQVSNKISPGLFSSLKVRTFIRQVLHYLSHL